MVILVNILVSNNQTKPIFNLGQEIHKSNPYITWKKMGDKGLIIVSTKTDLQTDKPKNIV